MNALDLTQSLHLVKKQVRLKYLEFQTQQVLANLAAAICVTRKAAPMRAVSGHGDDPYCLNRSRIPSPGEEWLGNSEVHLERRMFYQWCKQCRPEFCIAWQGIATYQVLLQDKRKNTGWGEIDLLGVSAAGLPIIIELKQGKADDTLLSLMLQALAYGIALQKLWPNLKQHWNEPAQRFAPGCVLPNELADCALVCAAPEDYWRRALRQNKGTQRHSERACDLLMQLAAATEQLGFPVTFISLSAQGERFALQSVSLTSRF